jgi:murein DD-endopeptidase MepM/ murein hydrolase activator NlpD
MFSWVFEDTVRVPGRWQGLGDGKHRSTQFMAWRSGDRLHAACDLMVPRGTAILAVCKGTVMSYVNGFKDPRDNPPDRLDAALTIRHEPEGRPAFIVRYGEVEPKGTHGIDWSKGKTVEAGRVIAEVGRHRQLHFELYADGKSKPGLSIAWGAIGRREKRPNQYTQDDIDALLAAGYDADFQRRADLANPSDFLRSLQRGDTPPAVQPFVNAGNAVFDFSDDESSFVFRQRPIGIRYPSLQQLRRPPAPADPRFAPLQRIHSLGEEDDR